MIRVQKEDFDITEEIASLNRRNVGAVASFVGLVRDGNNEIIISDYSGIVHIYDSYGIERVDDMFPFITGNQIWASPSAADLDGDGHIDFAIASKDKHLYVFDHNGLKIDYETESI